MRLLRKLKARWVLSRQGICPRHLVEKKNTAERLRDALKAVGIPYESSQPLFLFDKATCDLCVLEKQQREEVARERAIRELAK